jgi:hypothetical protein
MAVVNVPADFLLPYSVNTDFNFIAVIHEKEGDILAVNKTNTFFRNTFFHK